MLDKELCIRCFSDWFQENKAPFVGEDKEAKLTRRFNEEWESGRIIRRFNKEWENGICQCLWGKQIDLTQECEPPAKCPYILEQTLYDGIKKC